MSEQHKGAIDMRVDGDAGMESVPGAVIGGGVFAR